MVTPATDTIAAIATPAGQGGVGIVRLSGTDTPAIAQQLLGRLPQVRRAEVHRFTEVDEWFKYSMCILEQVVVIRCEYMAMKTGARAIMINPAISPSELLRQYIGVTENFEIKQNFDWNKAHCDQYQAYEDALKELSESQVFRLILLDMADELIDSSKTLEKYHETATVVTFKGGSHGFEHIEEAMPVIKEVIYSL